MTRNLLAAALLFAIAPLAHAGPFTDTLSTCLVKKTTEADRKLLVRWIFAAVSRHPDVQDMVRVSKEEDERLTKAMAGLYMDLVTVRCASEADDAIRYEGMKAVEAGFSVLGEVAGSGLMSHPKVSEFAGEMAKYVDQDRLKALGTGPAPAAAPAKP
jgi:hypothetical protein